MNPPIIFCLGTVAELIKVAPVMVELDKQGAPFELVGTSQHHLPDSDLFDYLKLRPRFSSMSVKPQGRGIVGFGLWVNRARRELGRYFATRAAKEGTKSVVAVHSDTVSTLLSARSAKRAGYRVAHIEAGLRSGSFLKPFPEELDRVLTARYADFHFCPYQSAMDTLKNTPGEKVNTLANTNVDALRLALEEAGKSGAGQGGEPPFFILIYHRQENLLNDARTREVFSAALGQADRMKCIVVAHPNTGDALSRLGLLEQLRRHSNVSIIERQPYFPFIALLSRANFILTDGGGNQQECSYLGLPTLILRERTESEEGIDGNVLIGGTTKAAIDAFCSNLERYRRPRNLPEARPAKIIADVLIRASGDDRRVDTLRTGL